MRWRDCRRLIAADTERLRASGAIGLGRSQRRARWRLFFAPEASAMALYRISHWALHNGHIGIAGFCYRLNITLTGADIHPASEIGPGCLIVRPVGTIIYGRLGRDVTIYARVVIDCDELPSTLDRAPVIGDRAEIGAMVSVLGTIHLADGVKIASGSLIDFSIDEPGQIVRRLPGGRILTSSTHPEREQP
jgi:serine acetyltransferase